MKSQAKESSARSTKEAEIVLLSARLRQLQESVADEGVYVGLKISPDLHGRLMALRCDDFPRLSDLMREALIRFSEIPSE